LSNDSGFDVELQVENRSTDDEEFDVDSWLKFHQRTFSFSLLRFRLNFVVHFVLWKKNSARIRRRFWFDDSWSVFDTELSTSSYGQNFIWQFRTFYRRKFDFILISILNWKKIRLESHVDFESKIDWSWLIFKITILTLISGRNGAVIVRNFSDRISAGN